MAHATSQMSTPWWVALISALASGGLAAGGAVCAQWVAKRRHKKVVQAEVSDHIADAFRKLVDELQEENGRQLASIRNLRDDAQALEKEGQRVRRRLAKVELFVQALIRHILDLEARLIALGATPPLAPTLPDLTDPN
jgi:hypothetical protein